MSRDTIKRRRAAGAFPNAELGDEWRIPVTDLIAAGFHPNAPERPQEAPAGADTVPDELEALRGRVAALERDLAVARATADERGRALELAELAMRALPAGPTARRPWWRRG